MKKSNVSKGWAKVFTAAALLLMLWPLVAGASTKVGTPKCWTVPAVFTGDQEVSFYYDVTDVGFPEGIDLYLWAWQPTEPDAGNGNNSSDFAKLEYLGNNIYRKTMVPTEYFHVDKSKFEDANWPGFWQQLKTKEDNLWSTEFAAPDSRLEWQDFQQSGKPVKFYSGMKSTGFTEAFTLGNPLTIVFNPDLFQVGGVSMTEFAQRAGFGGFKLHSGLNDWTYLQGVKVWIPGCMDKVAIQPLSNGCYSISMTSPYDYYSWQYADDGSRQDNGLESDAQVENLAWLVVGIVNGDWGGTSPDQNTKAGSAAPYPDPVFSVFPSRVSTRDILTLTREYNERTSGDLTYTITAGSKTVTGTMTGVRDKREATIDLVSQLAGISASELHLVVTIAKGATLIDTVIPLVIPDE